MEQDKITEVLTIPAASWGISLSPTQQEQFATYAAELLQWNQRTNLTAINDLDGILVRLFLDSLSCARFWGTLPASLIDVGSGAGFPGLPLKIAFPSIRLTLIESTGKKAAFLRHIVEVLGLSHTTVLAERAEVVGRNCQHREQYDVATARAVARLRVLAEYCLPLVRVGGRLLAPKGATIAEEVAESRHALHVLGGQMVGVETVVLPSREPQTLVVVEKVSPTPAAYPRTDGVPSHRPL